MSGNDNSASDSVAVIGAHLGRVKWFNSRLGYGFITVTMGDEEMDIFIHQSNVRPNVSKYRTLREGEYVSLNISESQDTRQAIDVTGVNGGPLNCDLERNQKPRRDGRHEESDEQTNGSEEFTEVSSGRDRRRRRTERQ